MDHKYRLSCSRKSIMPFFLSLMIFSVSAPVTSQTIELVEAASNQDLSMVETLLSQGSNVNSRRADGVTALLWAAHWDDLEMARLLLDSGADVKDKLLVLLLLT